MGVQRRDRLEADEDEEEEEEGAEEVARRVAKRYVTEPEVCLAPVLDLICPRPARQQD